MSLVIGGETEGVDEPVLSQLFTGSEQQMDWNLLAIPPELILRIRAFEGHNILENDQRISCSIVSGYSRSNISFTSVSAAHCPHFGPNPSQEQVTFNSTLQSLSFSLRNEPYRHPVQTQCRGITPERRYEGIGN